MAEYTQEAQALAARLRANPYDFSLVVEVGRFAAETNVVRIPFRSVEQITGMEYAFRSMKRTLEEVMRQTGEEWEYEPFIELLEDKIYELRHRAQRRRS